MLPGRHSRGTPAVRYRGFFINDENPALGTWAPAHFGPGHAPDHPDGFNSAFYAKVFEVMLRLKANYLWPAVWGRAFAENDPDNHRVASEYGVVMGTSHEAPMMRGIEEWNRHAQPAERDENGNVVTPGSDPCGGTGEWSYRYNAPAVEAYWTDGIRRMVDQGIEGVVTLGMRGPGDVGLPDEVFPAVRRIEVPARAEMGVAIDGSEQWWAQGLGGVLPVFSPFQSQPAQYVEVFNRGSVPFDYRIDTGRPWLSADRPAGTVDQEARAELRVDFTRAPAGRTTACATRSRSTTPPRRSWTSSPPPTPTTPG
ncbi:glycosyl hydrolase 115 family protein [Saccharopolyspora mangrovi]|uniref:Glycosyl hydrolase 115 family protein n=1 Tax=Saccharopolyspora mangrovi TaxID=3082379 RepID=A0ABU6AJX4_9PSEU|nr:glycosyl hydrolase 115 family protein [Saccharopolyspora sp. S2-29]MEB3371808.1 glycosyl hydrolase 115 family protein [Saccharopolyspora sp. S2-29]